MMYWLISAALATTPSPNWRVLEVCQQDMALCESVYTAEPRTTRNPDLVRFSDPFLKEVQWVPIHVARLLDSDTEEPVQKALISLLQIHDLTQVEMFLLPLFESDTIETRAAMIELIPKLSLDMQTNVLKQLTEDDSAIIRAQSLRVVARHLGANHPEFLLSGLGDIDPIVRAHAVKGLGWNDIATPPARIAPLLKDENPTVRLNALRTLERLNPGAILKMDVVDILLVDSDPKVRREILRIQKKY